MPYHPRKNPDGGYDIIKSDTGKKVGHSNTLADAKASIRARNAGAHGWRGTSKSSATGKHKNSKAKSRGSSRRS